MSSITIDRAIKARWDAQNCDDLFKKFWQDGASTKFHPFNDGEARPKTPMPYCVFEKGGDLLVGRSTGSSCEQKVEIEYRNQPFQLKLHGKSPIASEKFFGRTAKDILREIVGHADPNGSGLLRAFDDVLGPLPLGNNDTFMSITTDNDFMAREDDDVWIWVLQFSIQYERRRSMRGTPV